MRHSASSGDAFNPEAEQAALEARLGKKLCALVCKDPHYIEPGS